MNDRTDPARVEVVLVRPARPANVAAACRAMKNMALRRLRIVGSPAGLVTSEARNLAYGAWDVLDAAMPAATLLDAVGESTFVVGTTGRAGPGTWTPRRLAAEASSRMRGGTMSLVFGPEASGLTNEELALCHRRVHIPTSVEHSSLNLAQAVLILAYELHVTAKSSEPLAETAALPAEGPPATTGELEHAVQELKAGLLEVGYLNPGNPEAVLGELRDLLARAAPTPREVTLVRGVARQVAWAGRRARGRPPMG
jgi:TrmH family RNA methyltransferase